MPSTMPSMMPPTMASPMARVTSSAARLKHPAAAADVPFATASSINPETDVYEVTEDAIDETQAERLVQKAMMRKKK